MSELVESYSESCPEHGGDLKKDYGFGHRNSDAEVHVFHGCKCAVGMRHDPVGLSSIIRYFRNYDGAQAFAKEHVAVMNAKYGGPVSGLA